MANSSTQGNVTQASGHSHTKTNTDLKYRSTNQGQPLAHADVDDNFEILRLAINGVIADIDAVVKTDVPTGAVFTDTTYSNVTNSASGLMTAAMKQKLDGIAATAEVNVQADWNASTGDALILNKPNIAYTSAIPEATQSAEGLMSLADKTKLDGIEAGATVGGSGGGGASVTTDPTAPSSPSDGDLWFNENEAELYVFTDSLDAWIQTNGGGGSGGGDSYTTGWVSTGVANGATLSFNHDLGTENLIVQVYMAKDASGTDMVKSDFCIRATTSNFEHNCQINNITTTALTVQLGEDGWMQWDSNGQFTDGDWGTTYTHIKVVAIAPGTGTGGGNSEGGTTLAIEQGYLHSPTTYTKEPTRNANTPGLEFFCEGFHADADGVGGPFGSGNHMKVRLPTENNEWLLTAIEGYNDYGVATIHLNSIYHEEYVQTAVDTDLWLGNGSQGAVVGYPYTHNWGGYAFLRGTHAKIFHQKTGGYGAKLTAKWKGQVNVVGESIFSGSSKLADTQSMAGYNSSTGSATVLDLSPYVGNRRALVKLIVLPKRRSDYHARDIAQANYAAEPLHAIYFREHGDTIAPFMLAGNSGNAGMSANYVASQLNTPYVFGHVEGGEVQVPTDENGKIEMYHLFAQGQHEVILDSWAPMAVGEGQVYDGVSGTSAITNDSDTQMQRGTSLVGNTAGGQIGKNLLNGGPGHHGEVLRVDCNVPNDLVVLKIDGTSTTGSNTFVRCPYDPITQYHSTVHNSGGCSMTLRGTSGIRRGGYVVALTDGDGLVDVMSYYNHNIRVTHVGTIYGTFY